jgi:DNA-binding NarL/FixJ family response regulator
MSTPVTVFLVDDHELDRAGMRSLIGDHFEVVGEADNVDSAIEMIGERQPDVVLLDVHLPGGGGRRVAAAVTAAHPGVAILALSISEDPEDVGGVIAAGALGYLLKTVSQDRLLEAIQLTAEGRPYFSPALAGHVLRKLPDVDGVGDDIKSLTAREGEVLRLIARGYTYRQIGERLFISARTVETHVAHVLRKLHVANRHQLANLAREHHFD